MISGTFREWVDDGASGEWSYQRTDGATIRVALALYPFQPDDEQPVLMYEVDSDTEIAPVLPLYFADEYGVIKSGHVMWEMPGEVIDG